VGKRKGLIEGKEEARVREHLIVNVMYVSAIHVNVIRNTINTLNVKRKQGNAANYFLNLI
jgi:hypothetical protein